MKPEEDKTYEISSDFFDSFQVRINKGTVVWCSDNSHPAGTNWKSLKEHYENKIVKCYVKEVKEDSDGNPQTVS